MWVYPPLEELKVDARFQNRQVVISFAHVFTAQFLFVFHAHMYDVDELQVL